MNQKPKDYYVYLHRRATDGKVFYVGKGQGRRAYEKTRGRNKYWKYTSAKHGYTIEFYAIGLQEWYAFELEKELIYYYGRENLCNLTDGGDGSSGYKHTKEAKEKVSKLKKGVIASYETRKKMSEVRLGRKASDFHKKRISESQIGRLHSKESKEKMSNAKKGKKASEETKKKMSDARKGKKRSKESIEKTAIFHSKTVYCSNGIIFKSCSCAAKWLKENGFPKATHSAISFACRGILKTAYGYKWSYENDS